MDTSTLVKLCRVESETRALRDWLAETGVDWVTSTLTEVELPRAVARVDAAALAHVPGVLARCDRFDIDERVRADAAVLLPPELRTLDAIHLATALELADELVAFLAYDMRLIEAARANGLPVESPF
nr:type II toxin-antitoxin system VapC family toxin [Phytoactinopolyspora mesophila]